MSEFECSQCGHFMHHLVRKALYEESQGELDLIVETCPGCGERNIKSWQRFVAECVYNPGDVPCLQ